MTDPLYKIIAEVGNVELAGLHDRQDFLNDLGFSSLDKILMIMKVEDNFRISITDEDLQSIHTVGDLKQMIFLLLKHHNQIEYVNKD